jgi:cold shock protein
MKIGTVRWFNLQKGYGFIHADDGSFNIFVDMCAVERAGISDIKEAQRVNFEIQRNERTGDMSAVSARRSGTGGFVFVAQATGALVEGTAAVDAEILR